MTGASFGLAGNSAPVLELSRAALARLLGVGLVTLLQQRFTT